MSFRAIDPEVLLVAGYVGFLVLTAIGIGRFNRFSHRRLRAAKTVGFRYDSRLNAWQCSQGNQLRPIEIDLERRVARYRAAAKICNQCAFKPGCTESEHGRELVQPLDQWPLTGMARLHAGIALTLLVLAGFLLAVESVRHHQAGEVFLLASSLLLILSVGQRLRVRLTASHSRDG
jgi:hypothetical protein